MEEKIKMRYTCFFAAIGIWVGLILGIMTKGVPLNGMEFLRLDFLAAAAMMSSAGIGLCVDFLGIGRSSRRPVVDAQQVVQADPEQPSFRRAA